MERFVRSLQDLNRLHCLRPQFLIASCTLGRSEDSLHRGKLIAQLLSCGCIDWRSEIENFEAPFKLENASSDGRAFVGIEGHAIR